MTTHNSKSKNLTTTRFVLKPLVAAVVAAMYPVMPALAQDAGALEEVIVTAQKRTQSLQDVPVSVQVLGNQQLEDLNLNDFGDYIAFLPTVSYISDRPGIAQIYMRGISSGGDGNHSASMPSVGIYLDEQPITTINHVLDMHIYDVERIETLAGPQGTFFGASSQAGTIRIITNKPVIGEYEAGFDLGINSVQHGDIGYTAEGFVNIPVSDNAAIRLVGWHKQAAGYIDNVHGIITFPGNPEFVHDNSALVEKNFNDSTVSGMRAMLKVDLNENWTVTPGIIYQQQESNGIWQHDPEDVGDLKVKRFWPDFYDDDWYQASLTLEGDIGDLNLVYAGSYLDRESDLQYDYIGYAHYLQNYYYDYDGSCYHHSSISEPGKYVCTDSDQFSTWDEEFARQSHELRLQSSPDGKLRWIAGLFYQRQEHDYDLRWNSPGMDPLGNEDFYPPSPSSVVEDDLVTWQTDQLRVDRDKAFFGEVEFDLMDKLTVVAGYRYFEYENSLYGFNGHIGKCMDDNGVPRFPCATNAVNIDDVAEGTDSVFKFNLNYRVTDDKMLYVTYSEGFRPGGVNRAKSEGQFFPQYKPDYVDNYEFGWKTTWLDGRLRFNGAAYLMKWTDFQLSYQDPSIAVVHIIQNIGNSESVGTEFDLTFAATDRLRLMLAGSYNKAELLEPFWKSLLDKENGEPPDADKGSEMPFVPNLQLTATARLDVNYGELPGYLQAAVAYTDDSWTLLDDAGRQLQASYTILNLATGIHGEAWSLDLFLDNATDERGEVTRVHFNYYDPIGNLFHDTVITTNRPRTLGIRYGHRF